MDAWENVKEYLSYCLGDTSSSKALTYTSTKLYLQPYIDEVENLIKALSIIKEKGVHIGLIKIFTLKQYNHFMAEPYQLTENEYNAITHILSL